MNYKVGDRVKTIQRYDHILKDLAGTVVDLEIDDDGTYSVGIEFDANVDGHDCGGKSKKEHGYYVIVECLELEIQPTKHTVKIEQNGTEYFGYAFITCIKVKKDEVNHKIIYADGIKIEFDEICEVIN